MSPRPSRRFALCVAAVGALAVAAFAATPSRAAEDAVIIPPPTLDAQATGGLQTWRIGVSRTGAYAIREFPPDRLEFDRNAFAAFPAHRGDALGTLSHGRRYSIAPIVARVIRARA